MKQTKRLSERRNGKGEMWGMGKITGRLRKTKKNLKMKAESGHDVSVSGFNRPKLWLPLKLKLKSLNDNP